MRGSGGIRLAAFYATVRDLPRLFKSLHPGGFRASIAACRYGLGGPTDPRMQERDCSVCGIELHLVFGQWRSGIAESKRELFAHFEFFRSQPVSR
jgi:hypothetical protein